MWLHVQNFYAWKIIDKGIIFDERHLWTTPLILLSIFFVTKANSFNFRFMKLVEIDVMSSSFLLSLDMCLAGVYPKKMGGGGKVPNFLKILIRLVLF